MSATPLIGIVTVLFNSEDVLPDFFESLARQEDVQYRLYVIDNSKTDIGSQLSRGLAERYGVEAEIVFNDMNVGVAKGNNQGIALAQRDGCSYIALANNDIEFKNPKLLAELVQCLEERQFSAVVPKILFHGISNTIWFAGGRFSRIRATTPHLGEGQTDTGQYDRVRQIEYAPTCFMLVKSGVFEQIGAMDEKYFVYYDDTDFAWRMKQHKLKLGLSPQQVIEHKVSHSTGGGESEFSLYYGSRNRLYFIKKHYAGPVRLLATAYFLCTRAVKAALLTRAKRLSMLRGIRDGFKLQAESRLP